MPDFAREGPVSGFERINLMDVAPLLGESRTGAVIHMGDPLADAIVRCNDEITRVSANGVAHPIAHVTPQNGSADIDADVLLEPITLAPPQPLIPDRSLPDDGSDDVSVTLIPLRASLPVEVIENVAVPVAPPSDLDLSLPDEDPAQDPAFAYGHDWTPPVVISRCTVGPSAGHPDGPGPVRVDTGAIVDALQRVAAEHEWPITPARDGSAVFDPDFPRAAPIVPPIDEAPLTPPGAVAVERRHVIGPLVWQPENNVINPRPDGWVSSTYTEGSSVVHGPIFIQYGQDVREGMEAVRRSLGRERTWDSAIQEIHNFGHLERGWAPMSSALPGVMTSTSSNEQAVLSVLTFNALSSATCPIHPGSPDIHFHADPTGPDCYGTGRRERDMGAELWVRGWWTWRGNYMASLGHAVVVADGIFNLQGDGRRVTPLNWMNRVSREERRMIETLNEQQWGAWVADQVRSERDRALLERARAEHVTREEAARRADAERTAAEELARQLLQSMLSEADKRMLAAHGYFEVRGGKSGTRYRIIAGHHGTRNVLELDRHGHPRRRLCAHPFGVPDGDVLLAQKLVLETNEDLFLATANVSEP